MTPEERQRLEQPLIDYSEDREFTLPARFPVDTETEPLFEGNMVSQPMVVLKEGTYRKVVPDGFKLKLKSFTYKKKDLEAMVANSERDVPLNYDHMRGGPNHYGWVRTKTGKFYVDETEDGKFALFAQVEAKPNTVKDIESGTYRDFSPEVRAYEARFVGLALTNYPVMQGLHQFADLDEEDGEQDDFSEEPSMTEAERQALITQLREEVQSEFSEQLSTLQSNLDSERQARLEAERQARLDRYTMQFSDKIRELVGTKIAPAQKDALLSLYIFAAQHDEATLTYSEGEESKEATPVQLLDAVFSALPENDMFKQLTNDGEAADVNEEFSDDDADGFSEEEMNALRERVNISLEETE